ncbi:MAG: HEAT repeat domain-containing protein [Planctomycetota bacterium]
MRWGLTVAVVAVLTLLSSAVIWSFRLQRNAEHAQSQRQDGVESRAAALTDGSRQAHAASPEPTAQSDKPEDALLAKYEAATAGQRVSVLWEICQSDALDSRRKVTVLCDALNDPEPSVRAFAVSMLGNMGPDAAAAVPALAAALQQPALAKDVCAALGNIGPSARPALPALETLVTTPNSPLRTPAKAAIRKIKPR